MQTVREIRIFYLLLAIFVGGVWGLLLPWWRGNPPSLIPLLAGATLGLAGLAWPARMAPLARLLTRAAQAVGHANSLLLMTLLFLLVVLPAGLLRRLWRPRPRHPAGVRSQASAGAGVDASDSHYETPEPRNPADMTRMF